ncbi:Transposon Tf2-8 polyprotein, partial [Nosema granulosis]
NLLRKNETPIKFSEGMKKMVADIKTEIIQNAKIQFPDYTKKFILECDASDIGIAGVLSQEDKIIGYFSKKLHGAETNYSIVEKEYLAILQSLIHFKMILQGSYVEIQTDSKNCTFDNKRTTSRINNWKLLMNEFNYNIVHISGKSNVVADQLSRCLSITCHGPPVSFTNLVHKYAAKSAEGTIKTDEKIRVLINPDNAKDFLKEFHVLTGHRGVTTTYYNIKDFINIPNIFDTIRDITNTCTTCTRVKGGYHKKNPENKIKASKKFERISTDIYGPFEINEFESECLRDTGYILSVTDIYTRLTRLHFFERIESKDVIQAVESWSNEFITPQYIISDNGRQYTNRSIAKYYQEKGIKQILVPDYTPSSNGISERLNKTIAFTLTINKGQPIKSVVKQAENVINLNYNRSIGCPPVALCSGI